MPTRSQSEKLGVPPFEFSLPTFRKKTKKSKSQTSTSEVLSNFPPQTPPFPPFTLLNIPSSQGVDASSSSSSTQPASTSTQTPIMAGQQPARPWAHPGAIQMVVPLHPLPKHAERWLPKFNPYDGLSTKEHLHNYMLTINLNGVVEEYCVVRLFHYTLQGSIGSWYFSLPSGSIIDWDTFEEKFLAKFGDDHTIASLINDVSNLKAKLGENIKDFNSRFNKLLIKISTALSPGVDVQIQW